MQDNDLEKGVNHGKKSVGYPGNITVRDSL